MVSKRRRKPRRALLNVFFEPLDDPPVAVGAIVCNSMVIARINYQFVSLAEQLKFLREGQRVARIGAPVRAAVQDQERITDCRFVTDGSISRRGRPKVRAKVWLGSFLRCCS